MFVDSHCHINFPELAKRMGEILENMHQNQVTAALCVSVNLEKFNEIQELIDKYEHIYGSIGVHPDYESDTEPTIEDLVKLAQHPKIVAVGETGLDYFRLKGDLEWQRERFRTHIRAAKKCHKPLIVHTRESAADTLNIMSEEGAAEVGGVMHCFTETLEVALAAIEMNFYISFSGIVTFKNATIIKEVAQHIPLERMLIETDSPYLAPVPFRGKLNQPAYVRHVAEEISKLRGIPLEHVGRVTSGNFKTLFLSGT